MAFYIASLIFRPIDEFPDLLVYFSYILPGPFFDFSNKVDN